MKVAQVDWADFLREFDRQTYKSPPRGVTEQESEPAEDNPTLCACFNHLGNGDCLAHSCTACQPGSQYDVSHNHRSPPSGSDRMVPSCSANCPTKQRTVEPMKLRLNGSRQQWQVIHDDQTPSTSNGIMATTTTTTAAFEENFVTKRPRGKRPRESEKPLTNGFSHHDSSAFAEYYTDSKRRMRDQAETYTPVIDARKMNGKGRPHTEEEREEERRKEEEDSDEDIIILDSPPPVHQTIFTRPVMKTRGGKGKQTSLLENGFRHHHEEESESSSEVGSPKRKKRNGFPMSPPESSHQETTFGGSKNDRFRPTNEPGTSSEEPQERLTNGFRKSSTSPQKPSPVKFPSPRKNGQIQFNWGHTEDLRNHLQPTANAEEYFFRNANHPKERWRRSSGNVNDSGGGHPFDFYGIALTSPPFHSPRFKMPETLTSPLAQEAEKPRQNGKINGERHSFRNAKFPGTAKKQAKGIETFQTAVLQKTTPFTSDTLLTPPLPAEDPEHGDGTEPSILGPLALRPPDTGELVLVNPISNSPLLLSPVISSFPPTSLYSPLALVIPEPPRVNGVCSPKPNYLLAVVPKMASPTTEIDKGIEPSSVEEMTTEEKTEEEEKKERRKAEEKTVEEEKKEKRKMEEKTEEEERKEKRKTEEKTEEEERKEKKKTEEKEKEEKRKTEEIMNKTNEEEEQRAQSEEEPLLDLSRTAFPRLVVKPEMTMVKMLNSYLRLKFQKILYVNRPMEKEKLRSNMDAAFLHTKLIHETLTRNWQRRVNLERQRPDGRNLRYRKQISCISAVEASYYGVRWDPRRNAGIPRFAPPEAYCIEKNKHEATEDVAKSECQKRARIHQENMRKKMKERQKRKKGEDERKEVMYLEQMLPHISTDKSKHEEELKKRLKNLPETHLLPKTKDGAFWISSQRMLKMVNSAVSFRQERHPGDRVDCIFTLKDWNELRISYEGEHRLPKEVLVTVSPYCQIGPQLNPEKRIFEGKFSIS